VAALLVQNEVYRCEKELSTRDTLINDFEDFKEIKEIIMSGNNNYTSLDSMMIDTSSSNK
jgi:hypothetical protein